MSEMYRGSLIGGKELSALIKVSLDAPAANGNEVCVYPCRRNLASEDGIYEAELLKESFKHIADDLIDKQRDMDKFVSIRVHVSRIVWRQSNHASTGDFIDGRLRLDQEVSAFWRAEECHAKGKNPLVLRPGEFVVLPALEEILLPPNVYAFIQTRTTVALRGLDVTPTNLIVPGFNGCLYMEVRNNSGFHVEVPDFAPIAELFLFSTTGNYSGAGPEYENTVRSEPTADSRAGTANAIPEISVKRIFKALIVYGLVVIPIMAIAYFLLSLFPSVPEDTLNDWIVLLFAVCSIGFAILAFGKDIIGIAMDKIRGSKE